MAYLRLAMAAACPAAVTAVLYLWSGKTAPAARRSWRRQILLGMIFGAAAVVGSEFGVPIDGAIINVRDAAPLCAGLIFGPPAGIIAGVIGGLERWFAVLWGAGTYTRLACSVSTALAGCFAAALRKWMFDGKTPSWQYGFFIGVITEVFHMLMVFFTNMADVRVAFGFVRLCAGPMILANSCAVMCAVALVSLLSRRERKGLDREHRQLTQTFSKWLSAVVLVAFCATSVFTWFLQTSSAEDSNRQLLTLNLDDVKRDILDASDANLLELTRGVAADLNAVKDINGIVLSSIRQKPGNDFSEINVVDERGIITHSSTWGYSGFDMASGQQSGEFLVLLDGVQEYVQSYQPVSKDGRTYMKYAAVALERGGFVQVGYNAKRFRQDIDQRVVGAAKNRHVGENGYLIIAAEDWTIVSGPRGDEGENLSAAGIWLDTAATAEYARFACTAYGERCYGMYTVTEGYYIVAVTPVRDVVFSRDLSVFITIFMEMVFQSFNLFSHLMVIENIMLGPVELLGRDRQEAYDRGLELLELVGLRDKALNYPDELSGGQKQRVAIARTLAMDPEIVLFDEPTSALDPTMVSEVLGVIRRLAQEGMTMMIVTHEMKLARDVSTRIFYMDQGEIYEDGPPEQIFGAPRRERTRAFIQKVRTYSFDSKSRSFDFYALMAGLERFAQRYALSAKQSHKLQLAAEELAVNQLLPRMEGEIGLTLTAGCSEETGAVELTAAWPSEQPFPELFGQDWKEDISLLLLHKLLQGHTQTWEGGENRIRLEL